jgi:hypothetical protein
MSIIHYSYPECDFCHSERSFCHPELVSGSKAKLGKDAEINSA